MAKSKEAQDSIAKKREQQARDGAKAMAEYEAAGRATREKTARLKALRLAKEASQAPANTKK